jgi:hypothetical protein
VALWMVTGAIVVGVISGGVMGSRSQGRGRDVMVELKTLSVLGAVLAGAAGLALHGCNRDDRPNVAEPAPKPEPMAATPATEPASARVTSATFGLSLQPHGSYRVGQQGEVRIVLEGRGSYKVNDEYPYKFKLQPTPGLKYERMVVGKDAVVLSKQRATMTVKFTPTAVGSQTVAGRFFFSVCTDEKCLIERRNLALSIKVN